MVLYERRILFPFPVLVPSVRNCDFSHEDEIKSVYIFDFYVSATEVTTM